MFIWLRNFTDKSVWWSGLSLLIRHNLGNKFTYRSHDWCASFGQRLGPLKIAHFWSELASWFSSICSRAGHQRTSANRPRLLVNFLGSNSGHLDPLGPAKKKLDCRFNILDNDQSFVCEWSKSVQGRKLKANEPWNSLSFWQQNSKQFWLTFRNCWLILWDHEMEEEEWIELDMKPHEIISGSL